MTRVSLRLSVQAARIGLVLGLAAAPFASLTAQESARVKRGDWVRVRTSAATYEGRVWAIELDTVVITDDDRSWERVTTVGEMRALEVRRDRGTYVATGALVGTGVGVSAGLVFGIGFCSGADTVCEADEYFRILAILVLPPITVGTVVGLLIPKREWDTIPLDRLQLGVVPDGRGGMSLGLRYAF